MKLSSLGEVRQLRHDRKKVARILKCMHMDDAGYGQMIHVGGEHGYYITLSLAPNAFTAIETELMAVVKRIEARLVDLGVEADEPAIPADDPPMEDAA